MADDRQTASIADEAEGTRERISATIDELQDRLNPRRIVGDAVGSAQASGAELLNSGIDLVRSHPVLLAGSALAIGMALFGNSRLKRARVDFGDSAESYSDYEDDYEGRAPRERFAVQRQQTATPDVPVGSILAGLAAGALIGVLFPESERERRLLGASADRFTAAAKAAARTARDELGTARDKVSDVTSHARSAVQSVVDAAKEELRH